MFDNHRIGGDFGKAASHYDAYAQLQRAVRGHLFSLAKNHWCAGAQIVDLGCGTGAFSEEAKSQRWQVTGLDMSAGMCARAATKSSSIVCANAERLPLADGSADGIFSSLMLQWANSPQAVFSEMARVMTAGGKAAVATLVEGTLCELAAAFKAIDNSPHVSEFQSPHRLLEQAAQAGFSLQLAQQSCITEHYTDTVELMRALQAIGATNKNKMRRRGLMTPKQFTTLEQAYRKHAYTPRGLAASWQVLYLVLKKEG